MEEIKQIVAKNIANLRITNKLTQLELAEKLNYSDKAVSKWERGESIPDVVTLKAIADTFGVTVDYIITAHPEDERPPISQHTRRNHVMITLISVVAVWLLGTGAFTFGWIFDTHLWMSFVFCLPVSAIVLLVLNSAWGKRIWNLYIISGLMWTSFLSVFLSFYVFRGINIWIIFAIAIPAQIVISLCFGIKTGRDVKFFNSVSKKKDDKES